MEASLKIGVPRVPPYFYKPCGVPSGKPVTIAKLVNITGHLLVDFPIKNGDLSISIHGLITNLPLRGAPPCTPIYGNPHMASNL